MIFFIVSSSEYYKITTSLPLNRNKTSKIEFIYKSEMALTSMIDDDEPCLANLMRNSSLLSAQCTTSTFYARSFENKKY